MSEEIIKVLDHLAQKMGVMIDWTSKEIMPAVEDLCSRFIKYEITTTIFYMAMWSSFFLLFAVIITLITPKAREKRFDPDHPWTCLLIIMGIVEVIVSIVWLVVIPMGIYDIMTCNIFPEKIILDQINSLIGGAP